MPAHPTALPLACAPPACCTRHAHPAPGSRGPPLMSRVAVIGSGIAGLGAAWNLGREAGTWAARPAPGSRCSRPMPASAAMRTQWT